MAVWPGRVPVCGPTSNIIRYSKQAAEFYRSAEQTYIHFVAQGRLGCTVGRPKPRGGSAHARAPTPVAADPRSEAGYKAPHAACHLPHPEGLDLSHLRSQELVADESSSPTLALQRGRTPGRDRSPTVKLAGRRDSDREAGSRSSLQPQLHRPQAADWL